MPFPSPSQEPDVYVDPVEPLPIAPNVTWSWVAYVDHPSSWFAATIEGPEGDPDAGTWWFPNLKKIPELGGFRGHKTRKETGRPEDSFREARRKFEDDGATWLPRSLGYIVPYPARDPVTGRSGTYYAEKWEIPGPVIRGRGQTFRFDRQGYLRWLLGLLRAGVIPAPEQVLLDERREKVSARIARRESLVDLPEPRREAHAEEAREALALHDAAQVVTEEAASKPPAQRRRKGAA